MVVALEPIETIRVLMNYGSPEAKAICNTRPIHPVSVISGDQRYPTQEELQSWIAELTAAAWFVDATHAAVQLGDPIFGNIMMIGAFAKIGDLPMDRSDFEAVVSQSMPRTKVEANMKAYDMGLELIDR
jgi:indolepyruvate ferredoxin oxidoreductase beta subunit